MIRICEAGLNGIVRGILIATATVFFATNAHATLVSNGTFDTNLSGWDHTTGTIPSTWDSGTAHIGRPGTPGTSIFFQDFDIAFGTSALEISFDYQWQVNPPSVEDIFTAELIYQTMSGETEVLLLEESSDDGTFGSTAFFSKIVSLVDLANVADNGRILFQLLETDNITSPTGTRIQLDNVSVTPVPLPAAFPLFAGGIGFLGLLGWRRKRMATA